MGGLLLWRKEIIYRYLCGIKKRLHLVGGFTVVDIFKFVENPTSVCENPVLCLWKNKIMFMGEFIFNLKLRAVYVYGRYKLAWKVSVRLGRGGGGVGWGAHVGAG